MAVYGYAQTSDLANYGLPASTLSGATTVIQESILVGASRFADSYLRKRYTLPLLTFGEDLTDAVCAIAAWRLLTRLGFNPALGGDPAARDRHDMAIQWLKDVANGDVDPDVTGSPTSESDVVDAPLIASDEPNAWAMGSASDE